MNPQKKNTTVQLVIYLSVLKGRGGEKEKGKKKKKKRKKERKIYLLKKEKIKIIINHFFFGWFQPVVQ